MVTSLILEHSGHPVTKANFYNHQVARKLETEDKVYVKELLKARANPKNIANVLTQRKAASYNAQDVRNIIARINVDEEAVASVEESLGELVDDGGEVRYKKQDNTDNVEVIWVQTKDMRSQLSKSSPRLFECDTTFGTQVCLLHLLSYPLLKSFFFQVEGYKLYIPLYYSNFTSKWEVSGLLFLSTETKEKVEAGIRFFRDTLPYRIEGGGRFIFFTDKDFDYLSVLEDIFEGSLVLLCNVHTARYWQVVLGTGGRPSIFMWS